MAVMFSFKVSHTFSGDELDSLFLHDTQKTFDPITAYNLSIKERREACIHYVPKVGVHPNTFGF